MSIPLTGVLLIPLGLLIALLPWRYCLMGLMVLAMMSPAAVVNLGNFGLQPGYFVALLLVGRTAMDVIAGGKRLDGYVLARMAPLFLFLVVAFVSLFVALAFFQGKIETLPGTAGFNSSATRPFYLGRENFTQLAYLVLNLALVYSLGHQAGRRNPADLVKFWDRAFVAGLLFSAVVCVWQFASLYGEVPFAPDFFYSNAGYRRADGQSMIGLFRINGPFEEPATLGYVFTGYLLFAWARYSLYPTALSAVLVGASIFCMLVSTSTTAFLGLLLFACVAISDVAAARIRLFTTRISSGQITAVLILVAGLVLGSLVAANYGQEISHILRTTVLDKGETTSFQQRSYADLLAVSIFVETYGIGLGLGSHKANSLALTLLSNVGIVGLFLFAMFLLSLLRPLFSTVNAAPRTLRDVVGPFHWGLLGLILIHVFSNPNLSALIVWVQAGALLSLQAAFRKQAMALEGQVTRAAVHRTGFTRRHAESTGPNPTADKFIQ